MTTNPESTGGDPSLGAGSRLVLLDNGMDAAAIRERLIDCEVPRDQMARLVSAAVEATEVPGMGRHITVKTLSTPAMVSFSHRFRGLEAEAGGDASIVLPGETTSSRPLIGRRSVLRGAVDATAKLLYGGLQPDKEYSGKRMPKRPLAALNIIKTGIEDYICAAHALESEVRLGEILDVIQAAVAHYMNDGAEYPELVQHVDILVRAGTRMVSEAQRIVEAQE